MAHFAQLDENNIVVRVIVVNNDELLENGIESGQKGAVFCNKLFGGSWMQTSYNSSMRKNYAGVGYSYNAVRDAFIPPKPFESWSLNEDTCRWDAPLPMPEDNGFWVWNETTLAWLEVGL